MQTSPVVALTESGRAPSMTRMTLPGSPASGLPSAPELLMLHAIRLRGSADAAAVADRFDLDGQQTDAYLRDVEALGWVNRHEVPGSFGVRGGWTLTDAGRVAGEQALSAELDATGQRERVQAQHRRFEQSIPRLMRACTNWQIRPTAWDRSAVNDHTDWAWDERVLDDLAAIAVSLREIVAGLSAGLSRFAGYDVRFAVALAKVDAGDGRWVDRPGVDSCHAVWFELQEDLLATLALDRGT